MAVVNFSLPEIFEFACDRAGKELQTGEDMRTVRRCFNLLMLEWQNLGINLWAIEEETEALSSGTATYTLETDTVDVLQAVYRDSDDKDYLLNRMSYAEYAAINDKTLSGRSTRFLIHRLATTTTVTLWPVPNETAEFVYWRMRGLDGLSSGIGETTSATLNADMPPRFVPSLIAGLAFHIAANDPTLAPRVAALKAEYTDTMQLAMDEDRQRGPLIIRPRIARV